MRCIWFWGKRSANGVPEVLESWKKVQTEFPSLKHDERVVESGVFVKMPPRWTDFVQ